VIRLWVFLHIIGFTLWIGGGLASMVAGIVSKGEERSGLGAVVRAQSAVQKVLVAPGALLSVLSGLMLTFAMTSLRGGEAGFSIWLMLMQGAGLVAALLTLLIALPTAAKLSRLDAGGDAARYFDELRQRQRVVGSISGMLGLLALFSGAMLG
jgi:flagellar biosynthesis component FlhA